jgi:hypothetical protein
MWVLGSTLMIAAGLWRAMAAMVEEERRMVVRERAATVGVGVGVGVGVERRREP